MSKKSLEIFINEVKKVFGPLSSKTVSSCRNLLEQLSKDSVAETWLDNLLTGDSVGEELYRDPDHGFVLIGYSESQGLYRIPHDHGAGWVVYAVQSGEMEMGTYSRVVDQNGKMHLVQREVGRMKAGDCKVFLPGDIHDTRCISSSVTVLRFTSCDLKNEDREGRMIRYRD